MSSSLHSDPSPRPTSYTDPGADSTNVLRQAVLTVNRAYAAVVIELPARGWGIDRLIKGLGQSSQALEKRFGKVKGTPANQEILAHMIGMERWGQRRLRVALGEPLILEEYDEYRPQFQDWPRLIQTFHAVRQETISLSKSLRMAGIDLQTRVRHNQFGEISLLGWLFYLNFHARLESMHIH